MYKCNRCGYLFEEPIRRVERHREVDYMDAEWFYQCPNCGSGNYDEAGMCEKCGEYHSNDGPLCDDCREDLIYEIRELGGKYRITEDELKDVLEEIIEA